ncbi:MAG: hypothetical protein MJE63_23845 [Proteobacteria bacterium]|nr:hypothetical protein [Pseudomonadota bacterium]
MKNILLLVCLIFAFPLIAAKPLEVESKHPNLISSFCGIKGDASKADLELKFGKASKATFKPFKNFHTKLEDKVWELVWPGAKIAVYEIVAEKRFLFLFAEIDKNSFLPSPIIGLTKSDIVKRLGEPDIKERDGYYYLDKYMTGNDSLDIFFDQGKVKLIKCKSFID